MLSTTFIKYFAVSTTCIASAMAFYYLNTVKLPQSQLAQRNEKKVIIRDARTNKAQLIIIESPSSVKDSTEAEEYNSPENSNNDRAGLLPDVEFLKFVFKKGREGIPVLSIGKLLNLR